MYYFYLDSAYLRCDESVYFFSFLSVRFICFLCFLLSALIIFSCIFIGCSLCTCLYSNDLLPIFFSIFAVFTNYLL